MTLRGKRAAGLRPKQRGWKATPVDPRVKQLAQENQRLTRRLGRRDIPGWL